MHSPKFRRLTTTHHVVNPKPNPVTTAQTIQYRFRPRNAKQNSIKNITKPSISNSISKNHSIRTKAKSPSNILPRRV